MLAAETPGANGVGKLLLPDHKELHDVMERIVFKGWCLDTASNNLTRDDGTEVQLPHKAVAVLALLSRSPGSIVTRSALVDAVWDGDYTRGDKGLNDEIWRIRAALGDDPKRPIHIKTVPRKGYVLTTPTIQNSSLDEHTRSEAMTWSRDSETGQVVLDCTHALTKEVAVPLDEVLCALSTMVECGLAQRPCALSCGENGTLQVTHVASDICEIGGWFRPTQGSLVRAAFALSEVDRILRRHQLGLTRPLFVERTSGRILVHAGFIASLNHRSRTRPPVWESVDSCVFVAASQSKAVLRPVARWRIRRQLLRAGGQDGLRSTAERVSSFRWRSARLAAARLLPRAFIALLAAVAFAAAATHLNRVDVVADNSHVTEALPSPSCPRPARPV